MVVAALAVLLRDALPPVADISAWGERLVGGALIALGLWSLSHAARLRRAPHTHGAHPSTSTCTCSADRAGCGGWATGTRRSR